MSDRGRDPDDADRPDPTRIVADVDVLAADLLAGGASREALDLVRAHSWLTLVVSDPLLDEAERLVAELADPALAADWRRKVAALGDPVDHPADDHPALACAYRGNAAHIVSYDDRLLGARAGARIKRRVETSVKRPEAFVRLFDPATVHAGVLGGDYPGPDRDPRA